MPASTAHVIAATVVMILRGCMAGVGLRGSSPRRLVQLPTTTTTVATTTAATGTLTGWLRDEFQSHEQQRYFLTSSGDEVHAMMTCGERAERCLNHHQCVAFDVEVDCQSDSVTASKCNLVIGSVLNADSPFYFHAVEGIFSYSRLVPLPTTTAATSTTATA